MTLIGIEPMELLLNGQSIKDNRSINNPCEL